MSLVKICFKLSDRVTSRCMDSESIVTNTKVVQTDREICSSTHTNDLVNFH